MSLDYRQNDQSFPTLNLESCAEQTHPNFDEYVPVVYTFNNLICLDYLYFVAWLCLTD